MLNRTYSSYHKNYLSILSDTFYKYLLMETNDKIMDNDPLLAKVNNL